MMLSEPGLDVLRTEHQMLVREASQRRLAAEARKHAKADRERGENRGFILRLAGALGLF